MEQILDRLVAKHLAPIKAAVQDLEGRLKALEVEVGRMQEDHLTAEGEISGLIEEVSIVRDAIESLCPCNE